jgi:competence ComEA-like helix-hairpin-helix protein
MKYLSALLLLAVAVPLVCVSTLYAECKEGQVDINTASVAQLRTVKGIGPKKAEDIIAGRPYNSVDDLRKIKGVGSKTLDKWREQICVGKAGAAGAGAEPVVKGKKAEPKEEKESKEEREPKEEKESKESE